MKGRGHRGSLLVEVVAAAAIGAFALGAALAVLTHLERTRNRIERRLRESDLIRAWSLEQRLALEAGTPAPDPPPGWTRVPVLPGGWALRSPVTGECRLTGEP